MSHYVHEYPSLNYFNSNLIIQNFAVINITNNTYNMFFYNAYMLEKEHICIVLVAPTLSSQNCKYVYLGWLRSSKNLNGPT